MVFRKEKKYTCFVLAKGWKNENICHISNEKKSMRKSTVLRNVEKQRKSTLFLFNFHELSCGC